MASQIRFFWFAYLLLCVSVVVHSLKVAKISYDVGAVFFYISLPVLTMAFFYWGCVRAKAKLDYSLIFLSVMFLVSLVPTLYGYHGDLFSILGDLVRFLFVLSVISFFSNARLSGYFQQANVLRIMSVLALCFTGISLIILYYRASLGVGVYYGLQSTICLVSLSFALVFRQVRYIVVSVVFIALSGKRGVYLGVVAIFFVYFLIVFLRGRVKEVFLFFVLFVIGVALVYVMFILGFIPESVINRVAMYFGEDVDINVATAGRIDEIESVLSSIKDGALSLIIGKGLGSGFLNSAGNIDSTVHFSPLGVFLKYGFFGLICIYSILFFRLFIGFLNLVNSNRFDEGFFVWYLVFVGELSFSFTAFTLMQSLILWMAFSFIKVKKFRKCMNEPML